MSIHVLLLFGEVGPVYLSARALVLVDHRWAIPGGLLSGIVGTCAYQYQLHPVHTRAHHTGVHP